MFNRLVNLLTFMGLALASLSMVPSVQAQLPAPVQAQPPAAQQPAVPAQAQPPLVPVQAQPPLVPVQAQPPVATKHCRWMNYCHTRQVKP